MKNLTPILVAILLIGLMISPGTSSTVDDANHFCARRGRVGRFSHSGNNKYYLCYLYSGQLLGQIYTCPGSTVFDRTLAMCVAWEKY